MRSLTFAALVFASGCAPYPPIPPEDPCASDKLVCTTFASDPPGLTFCGYTVADDAGDERITNCPRQTYYPGPDGGKHFVRP
jgi:hypothetical protein